MFASTAARFIARTTGASAAALRSRQHDAARAVTTITGAASRKAASTAGACRESARQNGGSLATALGQKRGLSTQLGKALQNEIDEEQENLDPDFVNDIEELKVKLTERGLSIKEQPGYGVVKIFGTAPGGEKVTISFNCQDFEPEEHDLEGHDHDSEGEEGGHGSQDRSAGGDEEGEDEGEEDEFKTRHNFYATIARGGTKLECWCSTDSEGGVLVRSVKHIPAGADADDEDLFAGPPVDELDPALQEALMAYLFDCHVDSEVGSFVALYGEHKEQMEYINWLSQLKSFVTK